MKALERMNTASGTVEAVGPNTLSLTFHGQQPMSFQIAEDAVIMTPASSHSKAGLGDLKVGDEVDVIYDEQGTMSIAHHIALSKAVGQSR